MPLEFRLPRRRSSAMSVTRQLRPMALGVAIVPTLGLGACATYDDDFARVNSRLDQLDTSVQRAAQSATAANQSAPSANHRRDPLACHMHPPDTDRQNSLTEKVATNT